MAEACHDALIRLRAPTTGGSGSTTSSGRGHLRSLPEFIEMSSSWSNPRAGLPVPGRLRLLLPWGDARSDRRTERSTDRQSHRYARWASRRLVERQLEPSPPDHDRHQTAGCKADGVSARRVPGAGQADPADDRLFRGQVRRFGPALHAARPDDPAVVRPRHVRLRRDLAKLVKLVSPPSAQCERKLVSRRVRSDLWRRTPASLARWRTPSGL